MSESTALLDRTIADFAEAVRHNLADLPQDDIDDLTGGLEGDLAEQAIDQVGMFELGDPATYADELRSAAGLPERGSRGRAPRRSFGEVFREGRLAAAGRIRSSALGTWMLEFCVALAPVWWVARGWVGFVIVASLLGAGGEVLPQRPFNWLFLLGAIVVSVQWGRGRWLPVRWLNVVRTVASVVAIVAMPFVSGWALNELNSATASNDAGIEIVPPGLNLDGKRVTNIFGFDAEGNPIEVMQLFDQDGNPLVSVGSAEVGIEFDHASYGERVTVPFQSGTRGTGWNVYPLQDAPYPSNVGGVEQSRTRPAAPPFERTQPLFGFEGPSPAPSSGAGEQSTPVTPLAVDATTPTAEVGP